MNSVDILAKLLASENISVIRSNARTASFDVKNRVLVLPKWKEMSSEVEEMLILHEVGHALFTTMSGYLEKVKENRVIAQYANVIEDVRIERKMKERYPGSRKSFFLGYRELNSKNFFGVKTMNLEDTILIDRINLYYKVGYNCGVRFTDTERKFLIRIEKAETEQEVIDLANEIYAFSKTELKEKMDALTSMNPDIFLEEDEEDDDLDYDDFDYGDGDGEENKDEEEGEDGDPKNGPLKSEESETENFGVNAGAGKDFNESDLESKTYETMKNKLEDLSDDSVNVKYFVPEFYMTYYENDVLVPYKRLLKIIQKHYQDDCLTALRTHISTSSNNMVSYLIKEFEMKKAATAYKYAKISKTGQLDVNKIYAYKLKEDLFKQITKTQDGKKHGMIFLLDWSGSMINYLRETVDQVINLAMFCHRAQIPFQVLAFSDHFIHYFNRELVPTPRIINENGLGNKSTLSLLELFSHKMTNLELNQMIAYLSVENLGNRYTLPDCLLLGGTPLNESLVYLADYVGKFMKNNSVEKMSLITLTDGEGGGIESSGTYSSFSGRSWSRTLNAMVTNKSYLRDPITKKEYLLTNSSNDQTSALLNLIRDRYNCKVLGFYVVSNRRREIIRYCNNNMTSYSNNVLMDIQVKMKSTGYCIQNNIPGRDEFYLLDSGKMSIQEGSMDNLDSNSNSRQIAKTFSKMMNAKKTSRVVLNSFVTQIA